MRPPFVSYVTWNRLGLTIKNLNSLLDNKDEFELHIVDNNSGDDTWKYICGLKDRRIKSRTRFSVNRGQIYAVNYNLSKRKEGQFFITIDNDVNIITKPWLNNFLEAFDTFPEAGLLGAVNKDYYKRYKSPLTIHEKNGSSYLQIHKGYLEGCFQCFRPQVFNRLGYWCEETYMGDVEMTYRVMNYTPFTAGFLPSVEISQDQAFKCSECKYAKHCRIRDDNYPGCISLRDKYYINTQFKKKYKLKYTKYLEELTNGKRGPYCASVHDAKADCTRCKNSMEENFNYYIRFSN